MPLLEVKDLSLGYDGHIVASDLSFVLNEKDYLCIVGENGSGKTTLMKTLLSLRKPISGQISFSDGLSKNEIGYLPQQNSIQRDFPATVSEIVISGFQGHLGLRPFYNSEEKKLALENMKRMSIESFAQKPFRELSGGQQQRVLLARALCATGKVLIMDEPVSGLDPKVTAEMYELIKKLNNEGISIVMVSHDIDSALKYASHILHIGQQNFYGTTKQYLKKLEGGELS